MPLVRLVSWKPELAKERARLLKRPGLRVDASPVNTGGVIGQVRARMPAGVVIDLDRLPSYGREVAVALRQSKTTRHLPILFAGGADEKVEAIRRELPDAFYASWPRVPRMLERALTNAPREPVQPGSHMQRYAGSSLVKKLGVKPGAKVALLGAPEGFEQQIGDLPEGVELESRMGRQTALALWFVRSRRDLEEVGFISARLPDGSSIWIIHPKQTSRFKVDFNQNDVREAGLAAGLVDYKVCAVDADWSGLKFARKKK